MRGSGKQRQILFKVLGYIKRYWIYLGISILMAAFTVAFTLYVPILTGDAIVCGLSGHLGYPRKNSGGHRADSSGTVADECMQ